MAGVRLTLDYDDREVVAALTRLLEATGDLRPALADIGEYLLAAHDARFDAEQAPDGTPWAALDPMYAGRKAQGKPNAGILELDGFLRRLAYNVTADGLEFGTGRIYGATHQFGDDTRGIPARPFLGIADADRDEILALLAEHLADAVAGR